MMCAASDKGVAECKHPQQPVEGVSHGRHVVILLIVTTHADRDRAVVHIIDNGVGMSQSERGRAFRPFHRTKDPAFSTIPGAGLGLYTSRKLAEVNQGRLTLEKT